MLKTFVLKYCCQRGSDKDIPDICQFRDTTALFSPVNVHQKVCKFAKIAKIGQISQKKLRYLCKKMACQASFGVSSISYGHGKGVIINTNHFLPKKLHPKTPKTSLETL